jgi:hypothetical protein
MVAVLDKVLLTESASFAATCIETVATVEPATAGRKEVTIFQYEKSTRAVRNKFWIHISLRICSSNDRITELQRLSNS